MTKEDIIELARRAGFERLGHTAEDWVCHFEDIEEFTKLVAKKEREACAKEADKRLHDYTMLTSKPPQSGAAWSIASAIRARGNHD